MPRRAAPLALRMQFASAFTVMGCLMPFLSKLLEDRGLGDEAIGVVLGAYGLAVLFSPVLATLLADLGHETRRLLALCFAGSALAAGWLAVADTFTTLYAAYLLFAVCFVSIVPLQDALFFRQATTDPHATDAAAYTRVRVWGTAGFILPSLVLWALLHHNSELHAIAWAAVAFCGLGLLNATRLPATPPPTPKSAEVSRAAVADATPPPKPPTRPSVPTLDAVRLGLRPPWRGYLLGQWLLGAAVFAYYGFQPLYLTDTIGLDDQYLGLVVALGVAVEVGWMLAFGWLVRRFGYRRVVVGCGLVVTLRFTLLAAVPTLPVALATQLLHGPMVLAMHVAPPVLLNTAADDTTRSSVQGVYQTVVLGTARLAGAGVAGLIAAAHGYPSLMAALAAVTLAAAVVHAVALRRFAHSTPAVRE